MLMMIVKHDVYTVSNSMMFYGRNVLLVRDDNVLSGAGDHHDDNESTQSRILRTSYSSAAMGMLQLFWIVTEITKKKETETVR